MYVPFQSGVWQLQICNVLEEQTIECMCLKGVGKENLCEQEKPVDVSAKQMQGYDGISNMISTIRS